MMSRTTTTLALVLALVGATLATRGEARQVRVESGVLAGAQRGEVTAYLGVPYAAPPVGELRWSAPRGPASWTGVRQATSHAPACMQVLTPDGFGPWTREYVAQAPVSEDCLYLNVWTAAKDAQDRRPVLVWIHGGAFMSGSGSVPIYDGAALAARGVVVVALNYRLGPFGFAAFQELADTKGRGTNFGLQDVIAALHWVRANIAQFGGDPEKVTIAGQSAGAMAVHTLLVSPMAEDLFARAIAQSGLIEAPLPTLQDAWRRGQDLKQRFKAADVQQLRAVPAEQILQSAAAAPLAGGMTIGSMTLLGPVVDRHILPDQIPHRETAARGARVPVLVGLTADESVVDAAVNTPAAKELARRYGLASAIDWSVRRAARSHAPVYLYWYSHPQPGNAPEMFGAFHSSEIPYVFDTLSAAQWRGFTAQDRYIARKMSSYWINFVRSGDPNAAGLPRWPVVAPSEPVVMELGGRFAPYPLDDPPLGALIAQFRKQSLPRSIFGPTTFEGAAKPRE